MEQQQTSFCFRQLPPGAHLSIAWHGYEGETCSRRRQFDSTKKELRTIFRSFFLTGRRFIFFTPARPMNISFDPLIATDIVKTPC